MDLAAITQALGGLMGGGQQQKPASQQSQQQSGGLNINPAVLAALLPVVLQFINSKGGIQNVLGLFSGTGAEAQSWAADGPNAQISPEQVTQALGSDVDKIAQQAGVPADEAASGIAAVLPKVIDTMTPGGKMPSAGDVSSIVGSLFGR
jgi:uncharacterized protein YidB (DUF937 family)